jgi:S-adenosyl-L-methionine hydrolase (adenosine-forming)
VSEARAGADTGGAIFLLTDYGRLDELAGVVHAVLARLAPGAPVVDLTHDVAPFDVRAGGLALERAAPHLGPGVVLGVVDPGVGTDRRPVALAVDSGDGPRALVGPDNGLLCRAADAFGGAKAVVTLPAASPGEGRHTFDGRDVFAPAAAALWRGEQVEALGTPFDPSELIRLPRPHLVVSQGVIEAEVLWVDRFGNVQLTATATDGHSAGFHSGASVDVDVGTPERWAPALFVHSFGALEDAGTAGGPGLGLMVDANRHLALVCARRSAATVLGVQPGDVVTLQRAP